MLAAGATYADVHQRLGWSSRTTATWKRRFLAERLAGLRGRHRGSKPTTLTPALEARESDVMRQILGASDHARLVVGRQLDANERVFLRTLVRARPDWSLLDIPHLAELPAIRWRLRNLEQLSRRQPERFRALAVALDDRLEQ